MLQITPARAAPHSVFPRLMTAVLLACAGSRDALADFPCISNPTFPANCVAQLGPIGAPVAPLPHEGFLNIQAPMVDPVIWLPGAAPSAGRLYVLNPTSNMVRVLEASNPPQLLKDIQVCSRPSALAASDDASMVLVSCHASHAVALIDTATLQLTGLIQDRDAAGRPRLQEPMGIVTRGLTAWVASSQNNRIAELDLAARRVRRYIGIPGADPRALALAPDGRHLVVANFLAGNRTEAQLGFVPGIANPATPQGAVCLPLLLDPAGQGVFLENSPTFMDTSHPQFKTIAECYLFNHAFAPASGIVVAPARTDHDLVVIRLSDGAVVFTTDVLGVDLGALIYDVSFNAAGDLVHAATTQARNDLEELFGNRPILNRLVTLGFDAASGALSAPPTGALELDELFLDPNGNGTSLAATPSAVAVTPTQILVAAAGSDRLLVMDSAGQLTASVPVGFAPRGVAVRGRVAFVYDSTGMTLTRVDLTTMQPTGATSIGPSPLPQSERIGARLFHTARFSSNGTFACASCHPDGHSDGLVWQLNALDRLRATQSLHEISETAPYHWDGSKCNLVKILQDGITGLFGNPVPPTDCEMKTMIDYMDSLVRPHSPFRAPDDSMSDEGRLGLLIMHRGNFKSAEDRPLSCNGRPQDPASEGKLVTAAGDPHRLLFNFNGGGGPFPASVDSETCGTASCHVSPHWESGGFRAGDPNMTLIDGFQAVSNHGAWDRIAIMHDGRAARAKFQAALNTYRLFNGAVASHPSDNMTGESSVHGFNDQFFRHPEYNFDADPATNAFTLSDATAQFSMEEEELQTGAVGLSVTMEGAATSDPSANALLDMLREAANQGKIVLKTQGSLVPAPAHMIWDVPAAQFVDPVGGDAMTMAEIKLALAPGDVMFFSGALLPGQSQTPSPKLKAITRSGSPILCDEGYADYLATVQTGEPGAALLLHGIDVAAGSRVMVNGVVTGAALSGGGPLYPWTLPLAPAGDAVLSVQILSPAGLQSNAIPLPVVPPVVPAVEPAPVAIGGIPGSPAAAIVLTWPDQFGSTGPGTTYDIFRGVLSALTSSGYASGSCFLEDTHIAGIVDPDDPGPDKGFYYLARAENQINVSTWGSARRDIGMSGLPGSCQTRF